MSQHDTLTLRIINTLSEALFTTLALHEIGHVIGLGHSGSGSVMVSTIPYASTYPTNTDTVRTDLLYGSPRSDLAPVVQAGGLGAQDMIGGISDNIVYGNQGNDTISARGGDDTVFGGQDADTIFGGDGADILYGNRGGDVISGGAGADTLFGGQEADTLFGGAANDVLHGNFGADLFVVDSGADTIPDFDATAGDLISGTAVSWVDSAGSVIVTLDNGATLELPGYSTAEMSTAWFI